MIQTELLTGAAIQPYLPDLARLRMIVFRSWPYLYDGSITYEAGYMAEFAASKTAAMVIARDDDSVVGASTCIALAEEEEHIQSPFRTAGIAVERVCYFGESVLLEAYRGLGLGVAFFAHREAHARSLPGVDIATFCAVERPDDHKLRPAGAVKLDAFWHKRGFAPTEMVCTMSWKQVDTDDKVVNRLRFWTKPLV